MRIVIAEIIDSKLMIELGLPRQRHRVGRAERDRVRQRHVHVVPETRRPSRRGEGRVVVLRKLEVRRRASSVCARAAGPPLSSSQKIEPEADLVDDHDDHRACEELASAHLAPAGQEREDHQEDPAEVRRRNERQEPDRDVPGVLRRDARFAMPNQKTIATRAAGTARNTQIHQSPGEQEVPAMGSAHDRKRDVEGGCKRRCRCRLEVGRTNRLLHVLLGHGTEFAAARRRPTARQRGEGACRRPHRISTAWCERQDDGCSRHIDAMSIP